MDTIEAIRTRTSIKRFTQQPVEREKIEQLLEAGAQAVRVLEMVARK